MASGIERDTRCIYRAPYHICMYIRPPTLITPHVTPTDSIYDACQLHVLHNVAVKSYIHVHGSIHNIPTGMYKWVHSDFNNFIINKCIQRDVLTFSQDLHILIVKHAFIYFNSHAHMSSLHTPIQTCIHRIAAYMFGVSVWLMPREALLKYMCLYAIQYNINVHAYL